MKLVVVVREDLRLTPGKLAVQVGHAVDRVVSAMYEKSYRTSGDLWMRSGRPKIVLGVRDLGHLEEISRRADLDLVELRSSVIDRGLTEIEPGTMSCIGLFVTTESPVTKDLRLYGCPRAAEARQIVRRLVGSVESTKTASALQRARAWLRGSPLEPWSDQESLEDQLRTRIEQLRTLLTGAALGFDETKRPDLSGPLWDAVSSIPGAEDERTTSARGLLRRLVDLHGVRVTPESASLKSAAHEWLGR